MFAITEGYRVMLRTGLRLVALSVPLFLIGFWSLSSAWFEVVRLIGAACLTVGIVLLLINYVRTPDPEES
jgi:hypothetical protein